MASLCLSLGIDAIAGAAPQLSGAACMFCILSDQRIRRISIR